MNRVTSNADISNYYNPLRESTIRQDSHRSTELFDFRGRFPGPSTESYSRTTRTVFLAKRVCSIYTYRSELEDPWHSPPVVPNSCQFLRWRSSRRPRGSACSRFSAWWSAGSSSAPWAAAVEAASTSVAGVVVAGVVRTAGAVRRLSWSLRLSSWTRPLKTNGFLLKICFLIYT